MNTTLNLKVRDIDLGNVKTTDAFEEFLYTGGSFSDLLKKDKESVQMPMALAEEGFWLVNPSFQRLFMAAGRDNVAVFQDDPYWITTAVQYLSGQHQGCSVFLGTSDDRGNYVTCEINENFPPNSFFTSLRLHELVSKTQAAFSAKQRSGTIAILDCEKGRDSGDIEQFLKTSGIAHSPDVFTNPMEGSSALTNTVQIVQLMLSIENRTFYRKSSKSIPWFTNGKTNQRTGLLVSINPSTPLMLEFTAPEPSIESKKLNRKQFLITISGDVESELLENLGKVSVWIEQKYSMAEMEKMTWATDTGHSQQFRVCLVADTLDKLKEEIEQARKGITSSLQSGKEWQSRSGSYFTPKPLGTDTKIAFVYPGAFNSYIGMGAELLHCFPFLHDWLSEHNENPEEIYQAANLFPPTWGSVSTEQLEEMQLDLLRHPLSMLFSGTAIAGMYTYLLEQLLNVKPDAAYGYSLGEIMMFFATGYWRKTGPIKKEITESDLYKNRIAGSMDAVREFWDDMGFSYTDSETIWNNMILMTSLDKVKTAVEKEPLVYLTHVNTHRQVVIGGEPEACQRVVSNLRCMRFPIPVNYPMHCAPVASEFETLHNLNLQPIEEPTSIKFYSSYNCGPYALESNAIAETVAGGLVNQVDFDALTKRIYEDGYRFFIEVGARSNCSKWIERSLKSKDFCAVSVNQAEIADEICLMKVISRLVSHGKQVKIPMVNTNGEV